MNDWEIALTIEKRQLLEDMIIKWLDNHESAPSAHTMVHFTIYGIDINTDKDTQQFYECSESWNDSERDRKIRSMKVYDLIALAAQVVEISDEKLD